MTQAHPQPGTIRTIEYLLTIITIFKDLNREPEIEDTIFEGGNPEKYGCFILEDETVQRVLILDAYNDAPYRLLWDSINDKSTSV